jgi:hypothetical protein
MSGGTGRTAQSGLSFTQCSVLAIFHDELRKDNLYQHIQQLPLLLLLFAAFALLLVDESLFWRFLFFCDLDQGMGKCCCCLLLKQNRIKFSYFLIFYFIKKEKKTLEIPNHFSFLSRV